MARRAGYSKYERKSNRPDRVEKPEGGLYPAVEQ